MDYPYKSIQINQRNVSLADIQSGKAIAQSDFESSTFSFIRGWFSGETLFSLKTSGSTGTPKAISITREQLIRSAQRTLKALHVSSSDTVLVCLNTRYIAGKMMLVRALVGGLEIIAVEPSSNPLEKIATTHSIKFMAVVPAQLQTILSSAQGVRYLNTMNAIIVGGAPVSEELKQKIQAVLCPVYATFGMTETISHIALQLLNTSNRSEYFQVLPGVSISVDERGCLVIQDEIVPQAVITNDLIDCVSETTFRFIGRIDHVINSGGIKVFPDKVEEAIERTLKALGHERNHFVSGLPHTSLGEQVVLILEGTPLSDEEERLLYTKLSGLITPYEIPKKILTVPAFTYTETGKVNKPATLKEASKE